MPNPDDLNDQYPVLDRIENSVASLPNPVEFPTRELYRSCRPGIIRERPYASYNSAAFCFGGDGFELLSSRFLDTNAIVCHAV